VQRTEEDVFEDVIYGSESEVDSEEEEAKGIKRPLKSALKRPNGAARLRADGDDPMDLLEGVGAHGLTCEHSYLWRTGSLGLLGGFQLVNTRCVANRVRMHPSSRQTQRRVG
jgi:hypothetical protein